MPSVEQLNSDVLTSLSCYTSLESLHLLCTLLLGLAVAVPKPTCMASCLCLAHLPKEAIRLQWCCPTQRVLEALLPFTLSFSYLMLRTAQHAFSISPTFMAKSHNLCATHLLWVSCTVQCAFLLQESEVQAEYDNVLREAKLLRLDLQHALTKCLEHKVCHLINHIMGL